MTGSHEHEYENQTCKKCKKHQKIDVMQCGPERHSSFHDNLTELQLARPKPKVAKPEVRHRLECRGKPRHEPPDMEFEEDSANNFLDKRVPASEPPKPTPAKCGVDIKLSNFKSKAIYCEVKLADLLSKAGPRVRPLAPGKYPYAPDSFRTSACCLGAAAGRDQRHTHAVLTGAIWSRRSTAITSLPTPVAHSTRFLILSSIANWRLNTNECCKMKSGGKIW